MASCGTHDIVVLHPVGLGPSTHHERVVVRNDGHHFDALGLDLVEVLDEAREMADGAPPREGTCSVLIKIGPALPLVQPIPGTAKRTTFLSAHSLLAE